MRLTFRRAAASSYDVYADGVRVGSVWGGYNIFLRDYWANDKRHKGRRMIYRAFRTRRDAALDLCGVEVEWKES